MIAAAEWEELGHRNYRRREQYSVEWRDHTGVELDLNLFVVRGCKFGGPVAMVEDENKVPRTQEFFLRIFSPSGTLLCAVPWRVSGRLAGLDWTNDEHLVAILSTAEVKVFDLFGREVRSFSMGRMCESSNIAEASICGNGLVVRTAGAHFRLWAVFNVLDPKEEPFMLRDPCMERPPLCMLAVDPKITKESGRDIQVLVGSADLDEVVCLSRRQRSIPGKGRTVRALRLSPNAMMLAMYDEKGEVCVMSRDFVKCISRFRFPDSLFGSASGSTSSGVTFPLQFEWCGNDALVLVWPKHVIVASGSPSGHLQKNSIDYEYPTGTYLRLVGECDCIRIISSDSYETLEIVDHFTQDIFQIGSTEKASNLYDSFEEFENGDARADSKRRMITDEADLEDSVDACLAAARKELDNMEIQRRLLGAAAYGKVFISDPESFSHEAFVETCKALRCLNQLRKDKSVAMPLTALQFEALSPRVVIERLIYRRQHLLAIRMAQYLKVPFDEALEHWAVIKIECSPKSVSDDTIVFEIRSKLRDFPEFSYAKIANAARKRSAALAIQLLEYEQRPSDAVRKLIEFDEFEIALGKAVSSMDCDLVYMVLSHLISRYGQSEVDFLKLFELIDAHSDGVSTSDSMSGGPSSLSSPFPSSGLVTARTMFVQLCQTEAATSASERVAELHSELLRRYWDYRKDGRSLGFDYLKQSVLSDNVTDSLILTEKAMEYLERDKELNFALRMTADFKRSLKYQKSLHLELQDSLGSSVLESVKSLLLRDDGKSARKFAGEMDVSAKGWWHVMVHCHSQQGKWDLIQSEVSKMKKAPPPIGFLPIIEACVAHSQTDRARHYILLLSDVAEKLEWLCQLNLWNDAVDVAVQERDMDALRTIASVCKDAAVLRRVQDIVSR